jgi:hypothetical protein
MRHRVNLPATEFTVPSEPEDARAAADVLRARIEAVRQQVQKAVGSPVQIDRLEPMEHAGKGVLRVFWRKVQVH